MKFSRIFLCLLLSSCATKKEVHDLRAEVSELKKAIYENSEPVENHIEDHNPNPRLDAETYPPRSEIKGMTWGSYNESTLEIEDQNESADRIRCTMEKSAYCANRMYASKIVKVQIPKGYVHLGCDGKPANGQYRGHSCDAYQGDTLCTARLPVLCISKSQSILVPQVLIDNHWSRGEVKFTKPVSGSELGSMDKANMICKSNFGPEYRMAEFHDGEGWDFWAKGSSNTNARFWVGINDQRANCWDR